MSQTQSLEPNIDQIQIYQAENGALEIRLDQKLETVWLSQAQIAMLFEKDRVPNTLLLFIVMLSSIMRQLVGNSD